MYKYNDVRLLLLLCIHCTHIVQLYRSIERFTLAYNIGRIYRYKQEFGGTSHFQLLYYIVAYYISIYSSGQDNYNIQITRESAAAAKSFRKIKIPIRVYFLTTCQLLLMPRRWVILYNSALIMYRGIILLPVPVLDIYYGNTYTLIYRYLPTYIILPRQSINIYLSYHLLCCSAPRTATFYIGSSYIILLCVKICCIIHRNSREIIYPSPRGVVYRNIGGKIMIWNKKKDRRGCM